MSKHAHKSRRDSKKRAPGHRHSDSYDPAYDGRRENPFYGSEGDDKSEVAKRWQTYRDADAKFTMHARDYRTRESLHTGGETVKDLMMRGAARGPGWTLSDSSKPRFDDPIKNEEQTENTQRTSKAPTLADAMIRESFRPEFVRACDIHGKFRESLAAARKFVLNDDMSAFMADLANAPFVPYTSKTGGNLPKCSMMLDNMRKMARSPHHLTWIECNNIMRMHRGSEVYGVEIRGTNETARLGWLIHQDHDLPAFTALEVMSHAWLDGKHLPIPVPSPFLMCWMTDDNAPFPPAWERDKKLPPLSDQFERERLSEVLAGITGYHSDKCGIMLSPYMRPDVIHRAARETDHNPLESLQGSLRYLWSLLATINDVPTEVHHVTTSKGFVARGRYRKFSEHFVVTINIPYKQYAKVAHRAVAVAHKRAHQVRTHLRKNFRKPFLIGCNHEYVGGQNGETLRCKNCGGEKFWIKEHQRGDASLGFVLHDYKVTHDIRPESETPDSG